MVFFFTISKRNEQQLTYFYNNRLILNLLYYSSLRAQDQFLPRKWQQKMCYFIFKTENVNLVKALYILTARSFDNFFKYHVFLQIAYLKLKDKITIQLTNEKIYILVQYEEILKKQMLFK